jgi:hypothetical protein
VMEDTFGSTREVWLMGCRLPLSLSDGAGWK